MDKPSEATDTTLLAGAIVSYLGQLEDGEIDAVSIPENIKTDDEFLAWIRSAN